MAGRLKWETQKGTPPRSEQPWLLAEAMATETMVEQVVQALARGEAVALAYGIHRRKLPCEAGHTLKDGSVDVTLGRNARGGTGPRESGVRSVLYRRHHASLSSRTSSSLVKTHVFRISVRYVRLQRSMYAF